MAAIASTASASAPSPPATRRGHVRGSGGSSRARCSSSSSSNSPANPTTSVSSPASRASLPQRSRSSRHSASDSYPAAAARAVHSSSGEPSPAPPAARRIAASVRCPSRGPTRIGLTAGEPSSGRSRNGVGPGPTAQSPRSQASTGNPAAAIRSTRRPNDSASRAASAGRGRRVACHRSMLMPSEGATTRNLRPSCSPKSSTPQISEQASAHQRVTASVKPSSSQPSDANTIRTCAVRPDLVSSASIGPSGRARSAAGLARYRPAITSAVEVAESAMLTG